MVAGDWFLDYRITESQNHKQKTANCLLIWGYSLFTVYCWLHTATGGCGLDTCSWNKETRDQNFEFRYQTKD